MKNKVKFFENYFTDKVNEGLFTKDEVVAKQISDYVDYQLEHNFEHMFDILGMDMPEKLEGDEYEEAFADAREKAIEMYTKTPDDMERISVGNYNIDYNSYFREFQVNHKTAADEVPMSGFEKLEDAIEYASKG